jgi:pilus assembly protein CpaC
MNMTRLAHIRSARFAGAAAIAMAASLVTIGVPFSTANAQVTNERATSEIELSEGRAQIVNLPVAISDVVVSNDKAVSVQVKSPRQIVIFGIGGGESSVFATTKDGRVVYSTNVRVAQNINSVDEMLRTAMPEATIKTTAMNGMILLTGTIAAPEDGAEAERLVKAFMGEGTQVISRLKTATPLQVNLNVKISEVSRDFSKKIGVNLLNRDTSGGFLFGIGQGRNVGTISSVKDPITGAVGTAYDLKNLGVGAGTTSLGLAGKLLGLDILAAIDLAESDGLATTLSQTNLSALSGETASFLAGGEVPIPLAQGQGQVTVEFKKYGIQLSFTPTVLSDGRISMRVNPEVSQLSFAGAVNINGFSVPGISTRRVETTVELGSGQSFVIAGLLNSNQNNAIEKAPGLGDIPILGALFRSTTFRRSETELVIVVTPYLVKPVNPNQVVLPTDGYKAPTDIERVVQGQTYSPLSGGDRPKPSMGDPYTVPAPGIAGQPIAASKNSFKKSRKADAAPVAAPGFGY